MNPEPGQFYMLQTGQFYDPLLKRPFSIFDADLNELSFLVRETGRGTAILSHKSAGNIIDVIGPLGMSYPICQKQPVIIAGGMGIASLFSLIKRFSERAKVIYGAGTAQDIVYRDEIESTAGDLIISTDDGSAGRKGNVMDFINEFMNGEEDVTVYTCGPGVMLKKVAEFCIRKGIECYVSLEQNMACGLGSCLGCVVRTKNGYQRVCKEGPVFSASDIIWD